MDFLISLLQNVRLETAVMMGNLATLEKEVSVYVVVDLTKNTF